MNQSNNTTIVIPKIQIERAKIWLRRLLQTASWLITLGLLAMSGAAAAGGLLAWLITGSDSLLAAALASALVLGLAGLWQLLRLLDRTVRRLHRDGAVRATTAPAVS